MCRVDDSAGWKVSTDTKPRARREYKCDECQRTIRKGEVYHSFRGLSYEIDSWENHRMCAHCGAATTWLNVACSGWVMYSVLEELIEHWEEDSYCRSITLARLIAGMKQQWHDGRDPVPDRIAVRESVPRPDRAVA